MVTKYGMSANIGPLTFGNESDEVFIGRDLAHTRNYGEKVASAIDEEIKSIVENAYELAKKILQDNIDTLHEIAQMLLKKEKVTGAEFRKLFPAGTLPEKEKENHTMFENDIVAPRDGVDGVQL
jgi:cell division protease FtsH